MALSSKDLLSIKDMTADEIKLILDTAATFKDVSERDIKKVPALRGKTVINLSTRRVRGRGHPLNWRASGFPLM
jgi:aspartate carbamoyltransferase catalytic subunit